MEMNEFTKEIFGFKLLRDGEEMIDLVHQIDVQKWDDLGLEVKFDFPQPLNVSNGKTPDVIQGGIKKESFAFFISDESSSVLIEEVVMNIEVPS